jgi:hypothetical protein
MVRIASWAVALTAMAVCVPVTLGAESVSDRVRAITKIIDSEIQPTTAERMNLAAAYYGCSTIYTKMVRAIGESGHPNKSLFQDGVSFYAAMGDAIAAKDSAVNHDWVTKEAVIISGKWSMYVGNRNEDDLRAMMLLCQKLGSELATVDAVRLQGFKW